VAFTAKAGSATLLSPYIAASTYKSRVLRMAMISSVLALQVGSHKVLSHGITGESAFPFVFEPQEEAIDNIIETATSIKIPFFIINIYLG
jgi:hypothetical protein